MKKFLAAGIIIIIISLIGVPLVWKTWLSILTGSFIIWQAIFYNREKETTEEEIVENNLNQVYTENEKHIEE